MMRIEISATSPTYGGAGSLELLEEFLVEGMPLVGEAVQVVRVSLLLTALPEAPRQRGGDSPGGEFEDAMDGLIGEFGGMSPGHPDWGLAHEAERQKGSALTFRRSAGLVDVRLVSAISELDVFGSEPDRLVFGRATREIIEGLAPLKGRVKKYDDLDVPQLITHLESRLVQLPATAVEMTATVDRLRAAARARWDSMSEWDLVDVDWSLYDADARVLLDDPFFWDPADEESPHGDDTGFDVLTDYLAQRPVDALAFAEQQAASWGFASLADLAREDPTEHDSLLVATAFAELKVTGRVTTVLRDGALEALERRASLAPSPACKLLATALRQLGPDVGLRQGEQVECDSGDRAGTESPQH